MEEENSRFTIIEELKSGGKSEYVYLLDNGKGGKIIKKKYNEEIPAHLEHFENEVKILKKLKRCSFVPKLRKVKPEKKVIYMSYCGQSLEILENKGKLSKTDILKYRGRIRSMMKELDEKWGVVRVIDGKKVYQVNFNNVCRGKNGKLYLIDFGSPYWK